MLLLALAGVALGGAPAAPSLWVATQGFADAALCDSAALVTALRAQRPGTSVHLWHPGEAPPPDAVQVRLVVTSSEGAATLEVNGAGPPIARALPVVTDCKRDIDLAALIVDGALDDLRVSDAAPRVDSLAAPVPFWSQIRAGIALGGGAEQGPTGVAAAIDAQFFARYRFFEFTFDADLGVPSSVPYAFPVTSPESGSGKIFVTALAFELGLGVAPRLGPGHAELDALVGGTITFASATASAPNTLFQTSSQTLKNGFLGARLGYAFELPRDFFVGARAEERFSPSSPSFGVLGAASSVTVRTATLEGLGFVGVRFL